MANIIQFPGNPVFQKVDGYNILFPGIISKYYEHARGIGTDVFVVKHYTNDEKSSELMRGHIPPVEIKEDDDEEEKRKIIDALKDIFEKQEELVKSLDDESKTAYDETLIEPYSIHEWRGGNGLASVFVRCQDGVIGCGWYDSTKTRQKALKMASFVLYATGYINHDTDKSFWETTYSCLPYDSPLGRSDIADDIINEALYEEAERRLHG